MAAAGPTREQLAAEIAAIQVAGSAPVNDGGGRGNAASSEGAGGEPVRGPALRDASGQAAHDEALGVGEYAPTPAPRRPRQPKVAELAFSEALPHQRALDLAYKLVAQRERTAKQLRDKLAAKECSEEAIAAALAELQRHGFQSDERYARIYAEDKRRLQTWGDRRIRLELGRAGVSREVIDAVLAGDEPLDAPSELEAALELLRRKQPDLSDPKAKQRTASMLARRGLPSSVVFAALRQHEREQDDS